MFKNGISICFNIFSFYLKINVDKTSHKVAKDRRRVEAACIGRENYMNKLEESPLNDVTKGSRNDQHCHQ